MLILLALDRGLEGGEFNEFKNIRAIIKSESKFISDFESKTYRKNLQCTDYLYLISF